MNANTDTIGTDLKVLVLEDSPRDLELMTEQLSHAGYRLDVTHVENEAGFTASLQENSFDLILADFKLPDIDGFKALQISRELSPKTPFICISGTIGEDTAVELLKWGAVDYVLKDRPNRLPMAVKRALKEAEVKADYQQAIWSFQESEERMGSIYRVAPIGIGVVVNRVLKEVNPRVCDMTGYTRDELLGRNSRMLYLSQEEYDFVGTEKYDQIREKGTGKVETRWLKKDGSIINVELASTSIDLNDHSKGITFTALDITERKRVEEALFKSESVTRTLLDGIPESALLVDLNGIVIAANTAVAQRLNFKKKDLIGSNIFHAIPKEVAELRRIFFDQAIKTGSHVQFQDVRYDRIIDNRINPIFDQDGKISGFAIIGIDITERKQAETIQQLQYNIARATISTRNLNELFDVVKNELSSIIDAKNLFIALYNEETGTLSAIVDRDEKDEIPEWPAEKSITGYLIKQNRPMLMQKNEILRLHEEGIINVFGTVSEAWLGVPLKTGEKMLGAIVVQNYDHPDVYDQTSIEIMELVAHELSMFIDWQRTKEKSIKLSRAVEQSSVSIVITNKEGSIEYVNPFFTKLTGYKFEEVKGKNPNMLKSGHHSIPFYTELWDTLLSGNDWEGEMLNKKKNGELFWEHAAISPIVNNDGVITNFVAIKEDITDRKKMLEALVAAKEKVEKSDRLKTAFLQNISHEIRTPLNGILGFGELILGMDVPNEKSKEMIMHVRQSSKRLTDTITGYVDMASVVSGIMEVHKKEFLLQPLIEETIKEVKPLCDEKKIALTTVLPKPYTDIRLFSDRELIRKTIHILLDNALKFTIQGEIISGYRVIPEYLEFYVQDTGVGIADDKLEMIFDMFSQEDTSDTRAHEGSGLGLSIASGMVKLLGGSISVTSEKGKGSTFVFTVPFTATTFTKQAPLAVKRNDPAPRKPLVLVAEDEESNYLYMEVVLQQVGCDYLLAKNGEEAVACCKQHPDITLVLMDIKMPVMNGVEATRRIREFRPNLTIIATTAYVQTGDEQRFLAAGCNGYLPKPIGMQKLMATLRAHLTT